MTLRVLEGHSKCDISFLWCVARSLCICRDLCIVFITLPR